MADDIQVRIIRRSVSKGTQTQLYRETLRVGPHTCQIEIQADCVRFQSYAHAQVWSKEKLRWNDVAIIPVSLMKSADIRVYSDFVSITEFDLDREALVEQLLDVLLEVDPRTRIEASDLTLLPPPYDGLESRASPTRAGVIDILLLRGAKPGPVISQSLEECAALIGALEAALRAAIDRLSEERPGGGS